jgi:adenosine deaminase
MSAFPPVSGERTPRWSAPVEPYAAFPKITLHDHLDGSLRPETLLELAEASGTPLPYDDAESMSAWFSGELPEPAVENWDEKFGLTTRVMQTEEAIVRVAREWVLEAASDGVLYGEVRWAPEKHVLGGLPLRVVVEAVAEGLRAGEREVAAAGGEIRARQLLCGMRTSSLSLEIARLVVDTYGEWGGSVAGFDLAGIEEGYPVREHLDATTLLHREGIPYTIHAGEGDGAHSVWETVHLAHALRLGHGIRIIEDVTLDGRPLSVKTAVREVTAARASGAPGVLALGRTAQWVVDRGIPLEVCPTSNSSGIVDAIDDHPLALLDELGFTLTLNPDNRGMSLVSLSSEYRVVEDRFGWGPERFAAALDASVRATFLSAAERAALRERVDAALAAFSR